MSLSEGVEGNRVPAIFEVFDSFVELDDKLFLFGEELGFVPE